MATGVAIGGYSVYHLFIYFTLLIVMVNASKLMVDSMFIIGFVVRILENTREFRVSNRVRKDIWFGGETSKRNQVP
jgi:hypothetical protein